MGSRYDALPVNQEECITMSDTQHEYKKDVDRFMNRIRIAINLRLESDRLTRWHRKMDGAELRKESDKLLRDVEYTLYELIDNALEVAP